MTPHQRPDRHADINLPHCLGRNIMTMRLQYRHIPRKVPNRHQRPILIHAKTTISYLKLWLCEGLVWEVAVVVQAVLVE